MRFVTFEQAAERFRGKTVAVVGSAPSLLQNEPGYVDSHDVVVRVNNYKVLSDATGRRTDVHYSFYGRSIRCERTDLIRDGVTLCMCKCPNSKPIESEWHARMNKPLGVDFRYVYDFRKDWWFCDTFIPDDARFIKPYELLARHIPSTGFAAIFDIVDCQPSKVYLTGFDFFSSGVHNVDEKWRPGDPADPIGHRPDLELAWVRDNMARFELDTRLRELLA